LNGKDKTPERWGNLEERDVLLAALSRHKNWPEKNFMKIFGFYEKSVE